MKRILTLLFLTFVGFALMAQAPYVIPRDLRVGGSVKIANGSQNTAGTIRYVNGHFEFNQNGTWMRFDTLGGAIPVTTLPWDSVTGKPATFTPSAHTQDWSTVTGTPATFPPSAHTQDWTTITGKPTVFPTDTAHKVHWSDLLSVPSTFTPSAHTQDWSTVTGKPAEFTPAAHTQDWSTITGTPATYAPSAHTQSWTTITDKPTEFTPSAHTQDWTTITGKPAEFTPSAHTQSWTTITDKPLVFPPDTHSHAELENIYAGRLTFSTLTQTIPGGGGTGGGDTTDTIVYTLPTIVGNTYYIDPDYGPGGTGTIGAPYDSWTDVTWQANATYLQKRGTTWLSASGLNTITVGPVHIGAYGDTTLPRPIMRVSYTSNSNLLYFNGTYGIVRDMDIQSTAFAGTAIRFIGSSPYAWVYNCKITGFNNAIVGYRTGALGRSAANAWGYLKIIRTETSQQYTDAIFIDNVTDVEIAYCNIHDWNRAYATNTDDGTSSGDGMQLQTYQTYINMHHNIFKRNALWGNKFCIIFYNDAAPSYVRAEVWKNEFLGEGSPNTSAIYASWSDSTMNIFRNTFDRFTNYSLYNFGENTRFYYNLVKDTRIPVVSHDNTQGIGHLIAFNNVFYGAQTVALGVNISSASTTVYNNVFMAGPTYPNAVAFGSPQGAFTSNYNHFVNNVTSTQTLAQWQAATDDDDNSATGDPLFQGAPSNVRPTATTSPLLGSGILYDNTVEDFDGVLVTTPVSKGLYQSATAPVGGGGGGIPSDPTVIVIDSILTSNRHIFGDFAGGNYARFDSIGALTFHGQAAIDLNLETLPLAYGVDNQVQYAEGGLLRSEPEFIYNADSNRLAVDTVVLTRLKFLDGSFLESTSGITGLPAGMEFQTKMSIANGDELLTTTQPDVLFIRDSIVANTTVTVGNPPGYIPVLAHAKAYTALNIAYVVGTDTVTRSAATNGIYAFNTDLNYSSTDTIKWILTNNEGPGVDLSVKFEKSPYYIPIPITPPYLDGLTTGWYAFDTASYYDLNGSNAIRLYDKAGRKILGSELLPSFDFTSGWIASSATATGALTFNSSAGGGMNRNLSLNTRGVYRLTTTATTTGGTLAVYNANNTTATQLIGNISGAFSADFTSNNIYLYFRNTTAGDATFTVAPSLKRYNGNHLVQVTDANRPTIAGDILSFDATNDYMVSAISPTMSSQAIYIVAQVNNGGYKLYTTLTGIGELSAGVLYIGANAALSSFYDIDVKEIVVRNDATPSNDNAFKAYLMYKYNVVEN